MKCTNCGSEIAPNQSFCTKCGTPVSAMKAQVQQNPAGGQGFNNPPPPPPPPQPPKKGGVPIWAFLITILLVVAIMLGVYFFVLRDSDGDSDSESKTSSSRKNNNDDENDVDNNVTNNSNSNNTTNNTTNNTINNTTGNNGTGGSSSQYKVTAGNYVFKVPDDLLYQVGTGNKITIKDKYSSWLVDLEAMELSYTALVAGKEELTSQIRQRGITVNKVEEKTIKGVQCIVMELTYSGKNFIGAFIRANSTTVVSAEVVASDATKYDYNALETIIPVATSVEKNAQSSTSTTTNMQIDSGLFDDLNYGE